MRIIITKTTVLIVLLQKLVDVLNFLKVPQRDLRSRQVKIHKGSLSEQVENWDEVLKTLKGTQYESFLHADYQIWLHQIWAWAPVTNVNSTFSVLIIYFPVTGANTPSRTHPVEILSAALSCVALPPSFCFPRPNYYSIDSFFLPTFHGWTLVFLPPNPQRKFVYISCYPFVFLQFCVKFRRESIDFS